MTEALADALHCMGASKGRDLMRMGWDEMVE